MNPNRKKFAYLYIILILATVGVIVLREAQVDKLEDAVPKSPAAQVASFADCVAAGYPVEESYPARCTTPDNKTFTQDIGNEMEKKDSIRLASPRPNVVISSPLELSGEALGAWFFEASFPVHIEDAAGNVIANGRVQAKGNWMEEGFVPFAGTIEFNALEGNTGKLILEKDNPSGLAKYADQLIVPIVFGPPAKTASVKVYFSNEARTGTTDCGIVYPVSRNIPATQAIARAALETLISGPTAAEEQNGFMSPILHQVTIHSLAIDAQGVARVDFSKDLQAPNTCQGSAIKAEIEQTLKQFPTVLSVEISVNGQLSTFGQ